MLSGKYGYLDIMQHLGLRGEAVQVEIGELGGAQWLYRKAEAYSRRA